MRLMSKFGYACGYSCVVLPSCLSPFYLQSLSVESAEFRHALYLFRRENPLNPFLSNAQPPRIPYDVLLGLLHTSIVLSLVVFTHSNGHVQGSRSPASYYSQHYAAAAIAPAYCALTSQGLTNFVWWSFALAAVVLHHSFHTLIRRGKASISQLEGLKYDSRGA